MTAPHATPEHPHILIRTGERGTLRTVAELRDASRHGHGRNLWQQVLETARAAADSQPLTAYAPLEGRGEEDIRQGNRDFAVTHAAGQRVLACALAHLLMDESRFRDAALAQVETLFDEEAWPEWQDIYHRNRHGLDADLRTGQLSRDLGLAYDWLYPTLSPAEQRWFVQGLDERGIQPYLRAVEAGAWWLDAMNNWTTVVVGGMGICAMALGTDHPQAQTLLELALPRMRAYLDEYGPNGEFNECPAYAGSSLNPVLFFSALRCFQGQQAIPGEIACLRQHCVWQMYTTLPPGVIVPFGDGGPDRPAAQNIRHFPAVALATGDPVLQWFYLEHAGERAANPIMELLHFDPALEPEPPDPAAYPLGRAFPAYDGIVTSRTSWDQQRAACTVMGKAGHGGVNHTHPDAGQVIIQGYGQRLIRDLGKVRYPLDKKAYYHFNSAGHNVLTFDEQDLIWDPKHRGRLVGADFDADRGAFWTWDLTDLYEDAIDVRRSVLHLLPGIVAVCDNAAFKRPGRIRVRWHPEIATEADAEGHFRFTNGEVTLSGLIATPGGEALTFEAGRHQYAPPHDRDRMGNPLPQRHEPYMDACVSGARCRIVSLFAVHAPGESPPQWEATPDGWKIDTPDGVATIRATADGIEAPGIMPREPEHPFLLARRENFPGLRDRATKEPWATMAADAQRRVAAGPPDAPEPIPLQRYLGALALLYILEENRGGEQARAQAGKVHAVIARDLAAVAFDPDGGNAGTIRPMGAAFIAILALDLVYNDLTAEQVAACEQVIERQIARIDRTGAWAAGRYGTHGTWDIYKGRRTQPDERYYEHLMRQVTPDGVSTVAPLYAFARFGSDEIRPQKSGYADVLECTGIDQRYYKNTRLRAFYKWMFGPALTPAGDFHMFGDTNVLRRPDTHPMIREAPLLWRVGRFGEQAAAHAAWHFRRSFQGRRPPGHLLSYVLMDVPLPAPRTPRSELYPDGGAFFREPEDDPAALAAMLYNITANAEFHSHQETNAIGLAAYGARLLVNGGWLGPTTRPAAMNNTLTIEGCDHAQCTGAGLVEGLLADGFDYACGDAGEALAGAAFRRSLVFVHSTPETGGYVVTFDEVEAAPKQRVHLFLHPATESEVATLDEGRHHRARIDHHAAVDGVSLDIFHVTGPQTVSQQAVPSGFLERSPEAGHHQRIEAVYLCDPDGRARIATVYLPGHRDRPAPVLQALDEALDDALNEARCDGAVVRHPGGTKDLIVQSDGRQELRLHHDMRFQARSLVCRQIDVASPPTFCFVRESLGWRWGDFGFACDRPLMLFLRGRKAWIGSAHERAALTLYHPRVTGARLDADSVTPDAAGDGWIRLILTRGRHTLDLDSPPLREG